MPYKYKPTCLDCKALRGEIFAFWDFSTPAKKIWAFETLEIHFFTKTVFLLGNTHCWGFQKVQSPPPQHLPVGAGVVGGAWVPIRLRKQPST